MEIAPFIEFTMEEDSWRDMGMASEQPSRGSPFLHYDSLSCFAVISFNIILDL